MTDLLDAIKLYASTGSLPNGAVFANMFFKDFDTVIAWMAQEKPLVSVTIQDNSDMSSPALVSMLSEQAVAIFPFHSREVLRKFEGHSLDLPAYAIELMAKCMPLIEKRRLSILLSGCIVDSTQETRWYINERGSIGFDGIYSPKGFPDAKVLADARIASFGSVNIPILRNISASQLAELMDQNPRPLQNLRDQIEEALHAMALKPDDLELVRKVVRELQREVRKLDRDYADLIARRHNIIIGATLGTGVLGLGLMLPGDVAKAIAAIAGSTSAFAVYTSIWNDTITHRSKPYYFAWKAHKLISG